MARDDPFKVRHTTIPALPEGGSDRAIMNRLGSLIVTDFFTQLVLSGFAFHMQNGTEDAPANWVLTLDDVDFVLLADNVAGLAMIPLASQTTLAALTTGTSAQSYLEVDKGKARYNTSGTVFVPANLRSDDPHSANGTFYTGIEGSGTANAKSTVPDSVELARQFFHEDAIGTSTGGEKDNAPLYSIRRDPLCVIIDVGSIVLHAGAATAQNTGYCTLQFAQFDKALVV